MSMSVGSPPPCRILFRNPFDAGPPQPLPAINNRGIEVDAAPERAEIEIRTRNPEMEADWDSVWRERGLLKLHDQMQEIKAIAQERFAKAVSQRVDAGYRVRNLHEEKGNVFGRIAFDKFLASRKRTVEMVAVPKYGVNIDVRIYPPEIKVKTNLKWDGD